MQEEEKKLAQKRMVVRILSPEEQQSGTMGFFQLTQGELERMTLLENSVFLVVVGNMAGGGPFRLYNAE